MYKEKCAVMKYEEANLRKTVKACEERFRYIQFNLALLYIHKR